MTRSPTSSSETDASRAGWNFRALAGGQVLARALAFFTTAYLARVLGPEGFGVVGFAYAVAGYFALAVTAGLNTVGAARVSADRAEAGRLAASVMAVRLLIAVAAFTLSIGVAWALPRPEAVKWVIVVTGLTYFTRAINTDWVHKGLESNERVGWSLILTEGVQISLVLALVHSPDDVILVPVALFAAQLVSDAYLLAPLVRHHLAEPDLRRGWEVFRSAFSLTITKVMRTALYTVDILFIGFLLGERFVGLYDAAGRIGLFVVSLSGALVFSFLPAFSRARAEGPERTSAVLSRALNFAIFLLAPMIAGGVLVAGPLLAALFGSVYAQAALVLQVLLFRVALVFFRDTLETILVVYDRLTPEMWIMSGATVLAIALNALLVPALGMEGAAVATLLTEIVIVSGQIVLVRGQGIRLNITLGSRILLAAGLMAGVVFLIRDRLPVLAVIPLAAATYAGSAVLFGAVPGDVRQMLESSRGGDSDPGSG